ncbi:hypothetical protein GXW83_06400 [Streptacidiphilus sp. PB12-B1b]|uniref:hypothetical protein n=1 Tax=Streptacidiphilus sp. PB12-B1b TaxID=2705012 RepID=UPI0015FD68F4|nr:hypothetical protein [Streptacidiphilus sp. PB12-B1b]QMU75435.1 hypothetical protein GXW83_06400 [Streptacidiphilus sp. PB12-B1b]
MRHAPTAGARLRRAAVLASLLSAAWCAAQHSAWGHESAPDVPVRAAVHTPARASVPLDGMRAPAGRPGDADDPTSALVPIALGLVLTGIASYKHRGLPGGH